MASNSKGRAWKLLKPCIRSSAGKISLGLLFAMLASAVSLSIPWMVKLAIDDVFNAKTIELSTFVGLMLVAHLTKSFFMFAGRRVMLSAGESTALMVRRLLFLHMQSLSSEAGGKHGEAISRMTGDVSQLEGFIETGVPKTFNTLIMLMGALAIIFLNNTTLALVTVSVLPLHLLLYIVFKKPIKSNNRRMRDHESGLTSGLIEILSGSRVMAASTAEDSERHRFVTRANDLLDSKLKLGSLHLWQKTLAQGIVALGTVGVWSYGGWMVRNSSMETGEFMAFAGYTAMLYPLSLALMTQMGHTLGTISSAERVMDLLETAPEITESVNAAELPLVRGEIQFSDVAFSYSETSAGLHGIDTRIAPGEVVAITGPVGSGKSTLANLLARFNDPRHGSIYLDGANLADLPLKHLRSNIGIVFQEPFLFTDTLANNIRYSNPDAGDWEIHKAIETVGLNTFVDSLPDGIHTMVGEDGVRLSLGQKRRIDLARTLVKKPKVMILDSVFAEGDADHRYEEEHVFREISRGRTTLVIDPPSYILERATKIMRIRRNGSVDIEDHSERLAPSI